MSLSLPVRVLLLALLSSQNAASVVLGRYTRTRGGAAYSIPAAVMTQELLKIGSSFLWVAVDWWRLAKNDNHDDEYAAAQRQQLLADLLSIRVLRQMAVPAFLYALQNGLLFVAFQNLEVTTFQLFYQQKILVTAFLMTVMLGRVFSLRRWGALVALSLGVVLTQLQPSAHRGTGHESAVVGVIAVLVCCFSSAFASVYSERLFKNAATPAVSAASSPVEVGGDRKAFVVVATSSPTTKAVPAASVAAIHPVALSVRNVHLATMSATFAGIYTAVTWFTSEHHPAADAAPSASFGLLSMFAGFTPLVWLMFANQACGGIIVALVLKHTDNILKTMATAVAILLSGIASHVLFDFHPSAAFFAGSVVVLAAITFYSLAE